MWHNMGYGWMQGWGFGWILGLIFLIIIVWIMVRTITTNNAPSAGNGKSALDILKERYAKGEIDKNEFEEKKKDILS